MVYTKATRALKTQKTVQNKGMKRNNNFKNKAGCRK